MDRQCVGNAVLPLPKWGSRFSPRQHVNPEGQGALPTSWHVVKSDRSQNANAGTHLIVYKAHKINTATSYSLSAWEVSLRGKVSRGVSEVPLEPMGPIFPWRPTPPFCPLSPTSPVENNEMTVGRGTGDAVHLLRVSPREHARTHPHEETEHVTTRLTSPRSRIRLTPEGSTCHLLMYFPKEDTPPLKSHTLRNRRGHTVHPHVLNSTERLD